MDSVIEKFKKIGEKSDSKGGDWTKNVKDLFKNAELYHFDCKLGDRNELYFHYHTSKNENNLVSFTLWKEIGKFKCNSAFGFPIEYSVEKKNDIMYEVYRDCLEDLECLEWLNWD